MVTMTNAERLMEVSRAAKPYPAYMLNEGESGLSIFSAAFFGTNDVIHFQRNGMLGTCVDTDQEKMIDMAFIYPEGWRFHVKDGWRFAEEASALGEMWDVVSVDPFFDDMAEKAWETLELWLGLARRFVTITVHADTELELPDGWVSTYFPRNDDVGWLVIERA